MKWSLTNINLYECHFDYSLSKYVKTFKEEVRDHIKNAVELNKGKKIYLLLSGGMDSRFLGLTLLDLGVEFTAVTYAFSSNFNDYDSQNSSSFAKKHGIKHEIYFLTVEKFLDTIYRYAQQNIFINVLNPNYILTTIDNYCDPNGIFITGAGSEPKIENKKIRMGLCSEILKQIKPSMYNFTSERILFSFLNHPVVKQNWDKELPDKFYLRNFVYTEAYPNQLQTINKQFPEDGYIKHVFDELCYHYAIKFPHVFATDDYYFDIQNYYKKSEDNLKGKINE
jgi:hypothetical protein